VRSTGPTKNKRWSSAELKRSAQRPRCKGPKCKGPRRKGPKCKGPRSKGPSCKRVEEQARLNRSSKMVAVAYVCAVACTTGLKENHLFFLSTRAGQGQREGNGLNTHASALQP
jgi:hypothetical protein